MGQNLKMDHYVAERLLKFDSHIECLCVFWSAHVNSCERYFILVLINSIEHTLHVLIRKTCTTWCSWYSCNHIAYYSCFLFQELVSRSPSMPQRPLIWVQMHHHPCQPYQGMSRPSWGVKLRPPLLLPHPLPHSASCCPICLILQCKYGVLNALCLNYTDKNYLLLL